MVLVVKVKLEAFSFFQESSFLDDDEIEASKLRSAALMRKASSEKGRGLPVETIPGTEGLDHRPELMWKLQRQCPACSMLV